MKTQESAVSPYRWVVLVLFMLPAIATQIQWITFAPIAKDTAAVYTGGNIDSVDLMAVVFMLVYIPVSFPASWCIDRFGLKRGTGIGVVILGLCGFLRIFAPDYTWLLVFQIGCAIGQPFVLNSFTKVAANWFPREEEALASGLATMSLFLGLTAAMFAGDFIMNYFKGAGDPAGGIRLILIIYGIFSLAGMVLYLIFVRDRPKTPPNPIAAEKKVSMLTGMKALLKNRDFLLLSGAFFIGLGAFNAISSKIDTIFNRPLDIDPSVAPGIVGGLIIVGGIFGAVILSALSDKYRKRRLFLMITMATAVPLVILLQYLSSIILLGIAGFIFGFFLVSALPIGLTYAVEKTHPVPEATSNGFLMLSGQISGIVLTLLFNMWALTVLFGAGLIFTILMKEISKEKDA
ncbi:MAG TPA: MFS transporter [Spirochaetota bacterium]|nr:MFS transporter [Spirochaetota bacterium]HPV40702.1 MFS transporter [Spirochaetota bacterium]